MDKKRRLGRGLDALISAPLDDSPAPAAKAVESEVAAAPVAAAAEAPAVAVPSAEVRRAATEVDSAPGAANPGGGPAPGFVAAEIPVDQIMPNPHQPRKDFDPAGLEDLMASIASNGIVQPIVVRQQGPSRFELVSGERRLRAVQALGLATIPAVAKPVPDNRLLELALIENIQRADLNPIEKAEAFADFLSRYGLTQEDAARRMGIDRTSLANHLRLLELPDDLKTLVRRGAVSMGHARALAGVADPALQLALAKKTVRQGLSVRQIERLVARLAKRAGTRAKAAEVSPQVRAMERRMGEILGTKVRIEQGRRQGTGRIVIEYYNFSDFDRILSAMRA